MPLPGGAEPLFQIPLAELADDAPLPERLQEARELIDAAEGDAKVAAALAYAVRAALCGEQQEAEVGLKFARDLKGTRLDPDIELVVAFVVLRGGDPSRARAALRRAEVDPDADDERALFARALSARARLLGDDFHEARVELERLVGHSTAAVRRASAGVYARLTLAEIGVAAGLGEAATPHAEAAMRSEACRGLLRCDAQMLRGRAMLQGADADPALARAALSQAVWQLVRIGARRELGLCYLAMADVEAAAGGSQQTPAAWLARAHPLIQEAGTPQDQLALRVAFRAFGRRAVDRLVDADLGTQIDALRRARARLSDVLAAHRDTLEASGLSSEHEGTTSLPEVDHALELVHGAEETIIGLVEGLVVDRERIGHLVQVSRKIMPIEAEDELFEAVPRLSLELCSANAAELFERESDGGLTLLTRHGTAVGAERPRLEREVIEVLDSGIPRLFTRRDLGSNRPLAPGSAGVPADRAAGKVVVVPVRGERRELALAVVRTQPGGAMNEQDLERLTVFGSLAATSIERARGATALREAAARDAATVESIRDGVVTLGRDGTVRALNVAAARLLRVTREDVVGRVLASVDGMAVLAEALSGQRDLDNEIISLPHTEVIVRSRGFAGGVVATLQELTSAQRLAHKLVGTTARFQFSDLVGADAAFLSSLEDARRAASSDVPILVTGESGTGKEMLAQAIHNASPRSAAPFVGINVAAIPRELLESELFGYERGAFTGARAGGHPGKFELAESGTLLLDEIGEMSYEMQAKLLRVLQERVVTRLGGTRGIPIRARLIATTHRDLDAMVKEGSFRLDLFYRLRVVHLRLPSLRERRGDVPTLVEGYLVRYCERVGRPPMTVAPAVMERLVGYDWPGNVRELANLVEGEASLTPLETHVLSKVPSMIARPRRRSDQPDAPAAAEGDPSLTFAGPEGEVLPLEEVERRVFQYAIEHCKGNVAQAAKQLGVARGTFYNKIKRYGLVT